MLDIRNLSFGFDSHVVLDAVSLQVEPDEIVCLLGPSGCGKTTLLRIVAGLLEDFSGTIRFAEENLHQVAVNERGFGLMFQDFALFPHMTVAENIAYGLKRQRIKREIIAERVRLMLKRVGLEGFEDRDVSALSGGEKQRVALARSLAPQPRFLMLDEPLGSLDALLRDQLALELREIIKDAGLSAIYVTHDHREAYAIADRIAVMAAGKIGQVAEPVELYQRPASENVARFLGLSNIFRFGDNSFTQALAMHVRPAPTTSHTFLIHPDGVYLQQRPDRLSFPCQGRLESVIFRGDHREVQVLLPHEMRLTCKSVGTELVLGSQIQVYIAADSIRPFK